MALFPTEYARISSPYKRDPTSTTRPCNRSSDTGYQEHRQDTGFRLPSPLHTFDLSRSRSLSFVHLVSLFESPLSSRVSPIFLVCLVGASQFLDRRTNRLVDSARMFFPFRPVHLAQNSTSWLGAPICQRSGFRPPTENAACVGFCTAG